MKKNKLYFYFLCVELLLPAHHAVDHYLRDCQPGEEGSAEHRLALPDHRRGPQARAGNGNAFTTALTKYASLTSVRGTLLSDHLMYFAISSEQQCNRLKTFLRYCNTLKRVRTRFGCPHHIVALINLRQSR